MNPFLFSLNAVAPILLMVVLGIALRRVKIVGDTLADSLNDLCFRIFIPIQIYTSIYRADLTRALDMPLIAYAVGATLLLVAVLCLIVPRAGVEAKSRGAYIQGVFRGNIVLIALSLMQEVYGAQGAELMSVFIPIIILVYNVSATWVLAYYSDKGRFSFGAILGKLATNPFLIAALLGVITALIAPPIPEAADRTLASLGAVGTPLALIGLGAALKLEELKKSGLTALGAALIRQFLIPVVILAIAAFLGFRGERMGVLVCIFLSPVAAGSYVLAKNMQGDHVLAGQILLITTILSFGSMLLGLTVMRSLGLM